MRQTLFLALMPVGLTALLGCVTPSTVQAQGLPDAARGAYLYLGLPGGEPSCVECHGPDPAQNRNRLLFAAQGPEAIRLAITKASAMGYLRDLLSEVDQADLSAYLAQVNTLAQDGAEAQVWPWGLEFGRRRPGDSAVQTAQLVNLGAQPIALAPSVQAWPGDVGAVTLAHDCPSLLFTGERCSASVQFVAGATGRLQATLRWQSDASGGLSPVGLSAQVVDASTPLGQAALADMTPAVLRLQARPGATALAEHEIVNRGTASLTLGTPAITGPGQTAFTLAGSTCVAGLSLAPQARCTVRVNAIAPLTGTAMALLQWRNDAGHLAPWTWVVEADGTALPPVHVPPPAPPPPAPAPPPMPAPAPAPNPAPVVPLSTGGGGCSVALQPQQRLDPLLPALSLLAVLALWSRHRRVGAPGACAMRASQGVSHQTS